MKRKTALVLLSVAIVMSYQCNNSDNKQSNPEATKETRVKNLPIYLFDSLEHFFDNENWQVVNGTDTSYMLFSRQNDRNIKVYLYKMSQGDSVNNTISSIAFDQGSVVWSKPGQNLTLQNALNKEIVWENNNGDTVHIKKREKIKLPFNRNLKRYP